MLRIQVTRPIGYTVTDSKGRIVAQDGPHPWPFPATLPAPGHAPDPKPLRAPVAPRPPLPDTPAPF